MKYPPSIGIISGNGEFPIISVQEAKKNGLKVFVVAIKGETSKEIENLCDDFIWVGLGDFGKVVSFFKGKNCRDIILAGQVKHVKIFSRDFPDLKTLKLLFSFKKNNNTSSLLGSVVDFLEKNGFNVLDSTFFLKKFMPSKGVLTRRKPSKEEIENSEYGFKVAKEIAKLDIGQTLVVSNRAVVAVEAMEGTDETIRRAYKLTGGKKLTVIKVARPDQDFRYDVPVLGLKSVEIFKECNVSLICIEAEKTLILNYETFLEELNKSKISLLAM